MPWGGFFEKPWGIKLRNARAYSANVALPKASIGTYAAKRTQSDAVLADKRGMQTPQPPRFTQGLLLSPQHLQQAQHYHDANLAFRLAALAGEVTGCVRLGIDRAALRDGVLAMEHFAGVFPDGTAIAFEGSDAHAPPSRTLAEAMGNVREARVLLALPPAPEVRGGRVSAWGPRSRSVHRPVWDSCASEEVGVDGHRAAAPTEAGPSATGGAPASLPEAIDVAFAVPRLRLVLAHEAHEGLVCLPVAVITQAASGCFSLDDTYLPPALNLGALPSLVTQVRTLAVSLKEMSARPTPLTSPFGAAQGQDTPSPLLAALEPVLRGHAAVLESMALDPDQHTPRALFLEMRRLCGTLAVNGMQEAGQVAPSTNQALPLTFRPQDVGAVLYPLLAAINEALEPLRRGGPQVVEMVPVGGGVFQGQVSGRTASCTGIFLGISASSSQGMPAAGFDHAWLGHVMEQARVAAPSALTALLRSAMPGVPVHAPSLSAGTLGARPGEIFCALERHHPLLQAALAEGALAVWLPPFAGNAFQLRLIATHA